MNDVDHSAPHGGCLPSGGRAGNLEGPLRLELSARLAPTGCPLGCGGRRELVR